jgi:hypothetical protein
MPDKIKKRTAWIERTPILAEFLQSEDKGDANGRKAVKKLHDRGWHRTCHRAGRGGLPVPVRQQFSCLLLLGFIAVGTGASAQTRSVVPTVETIITRMVQARIDNRAVFRSYIVTRDYRLFGKDRQNSKSQVIADVTFVPPGSKKYVIQRTQGSGLGEKIVRRMLSGEAEITKDYSSTDISAANYDFRFIRAENIGDQLCYMLELLPRRKDQYLLRGNIWVDAGTFLLRRSEGEPANKSPSWWLRNVRLELIYGDVGGMWLQTASEATVSVRIFGQYTMVTRDLEYKIADLSAGSAARTGSSSTHFPGIAATEDTAPGNSRDEPVWRQIANAPGFTHASIGFRGKSQTEGRKTPTAPIQRTPTAARWYGELGPRRSDEGPQLLDFV